MSYAHPASKIQPFSFYYRALQAIDSGIGQGGPTGIQPFFYLILGLDHNCGHILLCEASESRPLPAYDMARSGEKMSGP